jgi:biotin operon repressor
MEPKDLILKIVSKRTLDNPITAPELTDELAFWAQDLSERKVRQLISEMRKDGVLILSVSKTGGGYFMARNLDEYLEFRKINYNARILDMLATLRAMDSAAEKQFNGLQMGLFGG